MDEVKNVIELMKKGLINPDNKLSLIPNWLSFSRSIGGILIPLLIYTGAPFGVLAGTVSFIALSDFLDGRIARKLVGTETKEGAMLDAVSDKIFSFLLMFFIIPVMPIFLLNVILEGVISSINGKILSKGETPKSSKLGKFKTWPLFISIGLSYFGLSLGSTIGEIAQVLMAAAGGLSVFTGVLECLNIKDYYETYKEICDKSESSQKTENDTNEIEQNTEEKTLTNSYSLSRENNPVIVFENEDKDYDVIDNDLKEDLGRQKKMKL